MPLSLPGADPDGVCAGDIILLQLTVNNFKPSTGHSESEGILGVAITGQLVPPHSLFPIDLVTVHHEKE